jgi:hypothetical protein
MPDRDKAPSHGRRAYLGRLGLRDNGASWRAGGWEGAMGAWKWRRWGGRVQ